MLASASPAFSSPGGSPALRSSPKCCWEATLDFLAPRWNLFRFSGGPGSAGGTGWSSGCFPALVFLWFSSQSVLLSLQLLQAPDWGPGWCLQQSLWGCRSKSKVSARHQVSHLCLLVGHQWNSQKNPPRSPCNNTKQLKKERFLLWMEEFSSLEMGLLWSVPKAKLSQSPAQSQYLNPVHLPEILLKYCEVRNSRSWDCTRRNCWGNCCWRHFISLENSDLSQILSKVKHVLRQRWTVEFVIWGWSCLGVKQYIHLKSTINIHSFQKESVEYEIKIFLNPPLFYSFLSCILILICNLWALILSQWLKLFKRILFCFGRCSISTKHNSKAEAVEKKIKFVLYKISLLFLRLNYFAFMEIFSQHIKEGEKCFLKVKCSKWLPKLQIPIKLYIETSY